MGRPSSYKTRQSEAILSYMASLEGSHTPAAQIVAHFEKICAPIALTTVYRHLERLTEAGKVRKYSVDGAAGACFQYVENGDNCHMHLHLKCEACGELLHLSCDAFDDIRRHMLDIHDFQVNAARTVLYGKCDHCRG